MLSNGYAVVDVETTGLFPAMHDRIAEIGIVLVDRDGAIVDEWCTLVNPDRDLGPQHIHRIRSRDVRQAPAFAEIAGDLAARLRGRVIVAHNLAFDAMFLADAYQRLGAKAPISTELGLCTMHLSTEFLTSPSRSLAACCRVAGVEHVDAHSALHDARACAGLLGRFIQAAARPEPWHDLITTAAGTTWPDLPPGSGRTVQRATIEPRSVSFLARMIDRLPRVPSADDYLALLDRALVDRHLPASEQDALLELAQRLGLSFADAMELHRRYLGALAAAATPASADERRDLHAVANLLGLSAQEVDLALRQAAENPPPPPLSRGDVIAFTGQMDGDREHWEQRAHDAGLVINDSYVTRETRLLVAADLDTLSGKAKKARQYGIPIISVDAFADLLRQVDGEGRSRTNRRDLRGP